MHLVALAWIYVALMMALAEAISPQGSVFGAVITLLMYGVLPLALVLYLLSAPARRRARAARLSSALAPDERRLAAGAAVAPVREETQPVLVGAVLAAADGVDAERAQALPRQGGEVGAPARGPVAARLPPET